MSILQQLKDRNVVRVTVAYAAIAWLAVQLAEFATSTFGAPDWVLKTFTVLLVLGLPVAAILAWAYDLTPSGIRKADEPKSGATPTRRTDFAVLTLFGIVLVAAAVLQFWGPDTLRDHPFADTATPTGAPSLHLDIAFPDDVPLAFVGAATLGNGRRAFAISPDGRRLAFTGVSSGEHAIYLRDIATGDVSKLPGTEQGYDPFFSPNGEWIAFFAGNELKRVGVEGGAAITLTEATNSAGGTWLGNERILAFTGEGDAILIFDLAGTRKEWADRNADAAPHALPDGRSVLWGGRGSEITWYDVETGELERLPLKGADPRYGAGFLFYTQGSTLYAARFNTATRSVDSVPVPVQTGLRTEVYGFSQWALSREGTFVYAPGIAAAENPLAWVGGGEPSRLDFPQRDKGSFEISPDGSELAVFEGQAGSTDLWLYGFNGQPPRKLTFEGDLAANFAAWMPNGREIIFYRRGETSSGYFKLSLDSGTSEGPWPAPVDHPFRIYSVSADGRYLGITRSLPEGQRVAVYDRVENRDIEIPALGTGNWGVAVSPAGDAVVYTSPVTGEYQNYLQPVPPTGARYQISRVGGAEEPRWSRDGSKVYYRSGQRIMVVEVTMQPEVTLSDPRVFYEGAFVNVGGRSYDIAVDGQKALVIQAAGDTGRSIRVVTNWLETVERKVAASERR